MNLLIFGGRVVADAELISVSGRDICNFRIAANKKRGQEVQFLLCTTYGRTALLIHQYAKKGLRIIVTGYLELKEYGDEEQKRIIPKCIVREFRMIDYPEDEEF